MRFPGTTLPSIISLIGVKTSVGFGTGPPHPLFPTRAILTFFFNCPELPPLFWWAFYHLINFTMLQGAIFDPGDYLLAQSTQTLVV